MKRKSSDEILFSTIGPERLASPATSCPPSYPRKRQCLEKVTPLTRDRLQQFQSILDWQLGVKKNVDFKEEWDMTDRSRSPSIPRRSRRGSVTSLRRVASRNSFRNLSSVRDTPDTDPDSSSATQRTERTSDETNYRERLNDASIRIDIGPQDVPTYVWETLDTIFESLENTPTLSDNYRVQRRRRGGPTQEECNNDVLTNVAHQLWVDSIRKAEVSGPGEHIWNSLLIHAIRRILTSDIVLEEETVWRRELLPQISTGDEDLQAMQRAIPQKRTHNESQEYLSPETFLPPTNQQATRDVIPPGSNTDEFQPPDLESEPALCRPIPDIFFGLAEEAIAKRLIQQGFPSAESSRYLRTLQHKKSILLSEPTQRSCGLRFPFFVIEGKSAATNGNIYKAQNQAGSAGACALKIMHDLHVLAVQDSSKPVIFPRHVFFSLTTQGPSMELWIHFMRIQPRSFHSYCFYEGRNTHWDSAHELVRSLKAIVDWASSKYMDEIIEKLSSCAENGVGLR